MEIIPWVVGAVIVLVIAFFVLRALARRMVVANSRRAFFQTRAEIEEEYLELQETIALITLTHNERRELESCEEGLVLLRARTPNDDVEWILEHTAALELKIRLIRLDTRILERTNNESESATFDDE